MLFAVRDLSEHFYSTLQLYADMIGVECVPVFFKGKIENITQLQDLLQQDSVLGGCKIEGVVVKNYERKWLIGGQPMPIMAGKFVSEAFKEVHNNRWGTQEKTKSRMEIFFQSFRTHARWEKAVQHLRDRGELLNEPRDIGNLFKEIHIDIEQEEKENVKEFLWREYSGELKRRATGGLPEWYKEKLANRSFELTEGI